MRVLLVDDDPHVIDILSRYLADEGHTVECAGNAATALRLVQNAPDVIVLDIRLPDAYGLDTLRELKERTTAPVILLTALSGEVETVLGLELGADDYITKPFSPREVLARIRLVHRRMNAPADPANRPASRIIVGDIEIAPRSFEIVLDGARVALTVTEFRILELLARSPGQVFTRAQLLDAIQADYDIVDRTLDKHINNLRKKIERNPARPARIITVRGIGYKLARLEASITQLPA